MGRCLNNFNSKARKLKPSSRAKARWNADEWTRQADYACIVDRVLSFAELERSPPKEQIEKATKSFENGCLALASAGSCRVAPGK